MDMRPIDVPGSVRLRDVSRPTAGETEQQRIERLAAKAIVEGVQLLTDPITGRLEATSARRPGVRYGVDPEARACECMGHLATGICKHLALALLQTGIVEPKREPATCPDCRGERGERISTGGYFSDWIWRTCSTCKGQGVV